MRYTCRSCAYVRFNEPRLWCTLHRGPCVQRCKDFIYEPGSDERERHG